MHTVSKKKKLKKISLTRVQENYNNKMNQSRIMNSALDCDIDKSIKILIPSEWSEEGGKIENRMANKHSK